MIEDTSHMDAAILLALGERNRLRIVELLNLAPRSVGEIADKLGLRQPQATKHLQSLERAGIVTMRPLGQRRIYALRRERFSELQEWLESLSQAHRSEAVLEEYSKAIKAEHALARNNPDWAVGRTLKFTREVAAPPAAVWAHWTSANLVRRWWSPEHFEVVKSAVNGVVGGRIEIVMQEGDGTRHTSRGRFIELTPREHLRFELGPLAPDGAQILSAVHDLRLYHQGKRTKLTLRIRVTRASSEAVPALAGMRLGWEQLLDKLEQELEDASPSQRRIPNASRRARSGRSAVRRSS